MTALLVAVTLASLGLSGALLVYVLKLSREERDRSEARAAALAELLESHGPTEERPQPPAPVLASPPVSTPTQEPVAVSGEPAPSAWAHESVAETPDSPSQAPSAEMFSIATTTADARGGTMRWLLVPAIGVAIVGLALSAVYLWNRPTAPAQAAESATRPLELVTLRHQRTGNTLVIAGLVRNPPDAPAVKGLVAVAFAFDKQGTFLTSGRAVFDFPQLQGGEESPFSITIPEAGGVGRHRVSFRKGDGIVPHVDRRSAPPAVQQAAAQ